jgi:hypothetical protein
LSGCLDAIQHRHGDVQYQDVRFETGSFFQQFLRIAHRLDNVKLRLEELCGGRKEVLVVIGEEYASAAQVFVLQRRGEQTRNHSAISYFRGECSGIVGSCKLDHSFVEGYPSLCREGYWQK